MPYELYLRHYNRDGTLKNAVINPLWARYTDAVNEQRPLVFALDIGHPQLGSLEELDIIEVLLRNRELGLANFTRGYVAILRDIARDTDDDGLDYFTFTCPGENHILAWRHILWYAGVLNRSEFNNVEAETIMKTLVDYNFTALAAHTPGDTTTRQRDGDMEPGMGITITTAPDLARGLELSLAFAGGNVLAALQRLAERGGGDFALTWQGEGTAEWVFEFYEGQRGADKSTGANRVLFSKENNTLIVPQLERKGAAATVAISAGRDTGESRAVTEVEGPDYAPDYDIETFVDARNEVTDDGRAFRAKLELEDKRAQDSLDFEVNQTANQFYSPVDVVGRKTYKPGDLVTLSYGDERVLKILAVAVDWHVPSRGDAFSVSVETGEIPSA